MELNWRPRVSSSVPLPTWTRHPYELLACVRNVGKNASSGKTDDVFGRRSLARDKSGSNA